MHSLIHQKFQTFQLHPPVMVHCKQARAYVKAQRSLKAAWDNCVQPGWMWWIADDLVTLKTLDHSVVGLINEARNDDRLSYPESCDAIREAVPYKTILDAFKQHLRNRNV